MSQSEAIRFVFEIDVTDIQTFKALVDEAVAISRDEPGTVVYDWYLDEKASKCTLYEAYESFDALMTHVGGRVFSEVGPRLVQVCKFVHGDVFGLVPDTMRDGPSIAPMTYWGAPIAGVSRSAR